MLQEPHISIKHNYIVIWRCHKAAMSDAHVQMLGCLDTRDTHSGCRLCRRDELFHIVVIINETYEIQCDIKL